MVTLRVTSLVWTAFCTSLVHTCRGSTRPNIVFILADDLGWDDVSFHGSTQIATPNLDTLAYDGILLQNYYVQPICTPTRGALLTGRHPIHTGLQVGVINAAEPWGLHLNETIMPEYLKQLGYATHIVGKWHLGFYAREFLPTERGFDSHIGYYQGCEDYWDHTYADNQLVHDNWGLDFHRNGTILKTEFGKYSTRIFNDEAVEIVQNHDTSKPLYLYMAHQAMHSGNPLTPLEAPWEYVQRFSHIKHKGRRLVAATVSALDDAVGNLTKALAERGMLNNTIIVFSTDNGGPAAGFDFNYASNWPLRGVKATLWEGGMRGAGFIWSPLLHKSSYTSHHMIQVIDWLPTLLYAAGYDLSKLPNNIDGVNQWNSLSYNEEGVRKDILHNIKYHTNSSAIRVGNMKLVIGGDNGYDGWDGWYPPEQSEDLRVPDHLMLTDLVDTLHSIGRKPQPGSPIIVDCGPKPANASTNCQSEKQACLFDIEADPCEYNNIAAENPDIVRHLMARLEAHSKTAVPPANKPNDPNGMPSKHAGLWVPWVILPKTTAEQLKFRNNGKQ